ncbi:MAG: S8 family serine peptidase, partial [Nitrospirota bacterium]|nr:S8 family serine peptidase [Nitrospirota bacterium]
MVRHLTNRETQILHTPNTAQRKLLCAVVAIVGIVLVGLPSLGFAQPPLEWAEGRILVQPRAGLSEEEFGKILKRANGKAKAKIGNLNVHIIEVPPQAEQAVARALSRNPHVKFAEVDALVAPSEFIPNDPVYPSQWHLQTIQASIAWDSTQGEGVTVAVLDSGIDSNHPDFQGQLVAGWNVVSNNSSISDHHGHGTAVAGILGAVTNNATAVAGIAGAAKVMPLKITEQSNLYAYYSDIAEALNWAANQGAKVANISYGPINSSTVTTAANYFRSQGGVVLTAGGNNGNNPGLADNPSMLYVSATDSNDVRPSWSNYGDYIDVAAPGQWLWTTNRGGGTGQWYGTSFSTPVAAGVVALIMSRNPSLSPTEVEAVLQDSADNIGNSLYYGEGRVNAARAVEMAGSTSG